MLRLDGGQHLLQVLGSFLFFRWFTDLGSPQLSQYLPQYNSLTQEKKIEWNARTCSMVHAIFVSIACIYIISSDEEAKKDMIWGDSWIGKTNIAIASGYLLADMCGMWKHFEHVGGTWGYVGHHLCALYAYGFVLFCGVLTYFANFRLMAEASTPFINMRWYFEVTGQRNSAKYFNNGLAMTGTFFLCRIVSMPYYYYLAYSVFGTEGFDSLGLLIQVSWIVPCIILDILNIFWFYKIVRGARKVIRTKSAQLANANGGLHQSTSPGNSTNNTVQNLVQPYVGETEKTKSD